MRLVILLIPAIAFALPPQRPEQTPPPAAQVNLNIVALDAKGQSVTDLTSADLRLWDDGKPQVIGSFRPRESYPTASVGFLPRQYSNRSGAISHATVILFDLMNMHFEDRGYVFNQLLHSLQQFEADDNLYLYLITANGTLYPVHSLPGSEGAAAEDVGPWTRDIQAKLTEAMKVTLARRPVDLAFNIDARVRTTFATLSMVAARLAAVPGRKNIVWLTHGVPISLSPAKTLNGDWVDYTPYVRQLSNTLDRADVSIYTVQMSPPGFDDNGSSDVAPAAAAPGRGSIGNDPMAGMGSEQTLDEFAKLTGGRAYMNNNIAGAIKQAVNDVKRSYLLSYAPPPENWDGKYHKIRITSTRKGVRLQARQGYFAFADQAASAKQAADSIDAAIQSPFDAAEIGLRATSTPLTTDPPGLHLEVRIDLAGVQLTQAGDTFAGQLATRFVEYQDDGAIRQSKPESLSLHFTREQRDAALKEGYALTEDLAVPAHVEKIRVIVFDAASTAIGSLTLPAGGK